MSLKPTKIIPLRISSVLTPAKRGRHLPLSVSLQAVPLSVLVWHPHNHAHAVFPPLLNRRTSGPEVPPEKGNWSNNTPRANVSKFESEILDMKRHTVDGKRKFPPGFLVITRDPQNSWKWFLQASWGSLHPPGIGKKPKTYNTEPESFQKKIVNNIQFSYQFLFWALLSGGFFSRPTVGPARSVAGDLDNMQRDEARQGPGLRAQPVVVCASQVKFMWGTSHPGWPQEVLIGNSLLE